jgi:hypothetical protein
MRDHVILLGWFVLTAIVNFLMRTKTAEQWEQLAQKSPRYAAFARLLRAVGVDPVKLVKSAVDFVRGEAHKRGAGHEPKASKVDKAAEEQPDGAAGEATDQAKPTEEENRKA